MSTQKYTGMSLPDRLTQAGLLEPFSEALRKKDESSLLIILTKVEINGEQAQDTIKSLLLDANSHRHFS